MVSTFGLAADDEQSPFEEAIALLTPACDRILCPEHK
jgi:hypothetical protein